MCPSPEAAELALGPQAVDFYMKTPSTRELRGSLLTVLQKALGITHRYAKTPIGCLIANKTHTYHRYHQRNDSNNEYT